MGNQQDERPGGGFEHDRADDANIDIERAIELSAWITGVTARIRDPLLTDETLDALRREVATTTRGVRERIALRDELEYVAMVNGWESVAGEAVERVLELLDDRIYDDLADELRTSTDPGESLLHYRQLRERCSDFDERLAHLALEHPHIPAATVVEDFPDIRWSARTRALLGKLEREQAWRHLDETLDDAVMEEGIEDLLDALEHPTRHIERTLERLIDDGNVPAWVWFSTIPTDHYHIFAHHISWNRLCGSADDVTWEYFSGRVKEALEYDPDRIATFEALAPEFHGTFHELIETAAKI